jgi:hypothetical protein
MFVSVPPADDAEVFVVLGIILIAVFVSIIIHVSSHRNGRPRKRKPDE